jgi:translation initiation factor IF-2
MSRPLRLVTILFAGIAAVLVAIIVRELTTASPRLPVPRPAPSATATAPPPARPAPAPSAGAGGYAVVASRNLFSPTRTEAPPAPPAPPPVVNLPKPNLYGVVLQDGAPIAYLEDPVTKRVARYRVGDTVAGGTLKTIESDSVVLSRPDGQIAVRLHDPTRPRPPAPPAAAPGAPGPGGATPPGTPPRTPTIFPPQGAAPPSPTSGANVRRPLPPSILGRIPPQATDAPPAR